MRKYITTLILILSITSSSYSQNNAPIHKDLKEENLEKVYQYINDNNLAVCAQNHKFLGVYSSPYTGRMVCTVFLGDYDLINDIKIISSKIYYVAGLTERSDGILNDASIKNFYIKLGNSMKVPYYNFGGSITYNNRNLIHFQSTDILNPPTMNAKFKSIKISYKNIYFPEAYGLNYNPELKFSELAEKSIQTLFSDFSLIKAEYQRL